MPDVSLWETIIVQAPSLTGLGILSWYLLKRLNKCEDNKDILQEEHSDMRVRIAKLETQVNGHKPGGYKNG